MDGVRVIPRKKISHEAQSIAPRTRPPDRVVVFSDLHIGAGARDGTPDPLECFFQDDQLVALLERMSGRWTRRGLRGALVLNGDVFDFVRVVRLPASATEAASWEQLLRDARVSAPPAALANAAARRFSAVERRYGLDAAEHDSVWKLLAMARGHPRVFAALADWCRAGHELVMIRGNHDVEWAWPGVRRAFRLLLQASGSGPLPPGRVRFRMHGYRRHNLHIEHGNSIRWTTAADGRLTRGSSRRLKQPFGSLINRYLLNPVEQLAQRAPGVPSSLHFKRLIRQEPVRLWRRLLRNAFRAMPVFGRATWGIWHRRAHRWWPTRVGNALGVSVLALPFVSPHLLSALGLDTASARTGAALLAVATPHLGLAMLEARAAVRDDAAHRAQALARRIAASLVGRCAAGARLVVLGHTHRPELAMWTDAGGPVVYANPGSWEGEDDDSASRARFVWCGWNGRAYSRPRLLELDGPDGRYRARLSS